MTGIKGGATFMGVLLAVLETVLRRESKTFVVLFDGGDPVEEGLGPPPVVVWREAGVAGAEFDSFGFG
jgi:hypothetical protein